MLIDAKEMGFAALNDKVRHAGEDCEIVNCLGQRFIGSGLSGINISIEGVPGNALGAYLDGAVITVSGNAQDAVGDTMNAGRIVINGNVGDAAGYAMRGGEIYVRGNAGYRAGIHMKAYEDKLPVIVIGGNAGSFLGEYQAGGLIIVLGLGGGCPLGGFPCAGMHGGSLFVRGNPDSSLFNDKVTVNAASEDDMKAVLPYINEYCGLFGADPKLIAESAFTVVRPDSANPYRQMYVRN